MGECYNNSMYWKHNIGLVIINT